MSMSSTFIAVIAKNYPPPPCISYANVHNYYAPYAYCSLAINSGKFSDRSPPTDLCPRIQCIPRHGGEAAVTVHPQIRRRRRRHSSSGLVRCPSLALSRNWVEL